MFEEVDNLIESLKSKQELNDYLERNIYPERLQFNHKIKYIPPLKELHLPTIEILDSSGYCENVRNKLRKIDSIITSLHNSAPCCPICMNELHSNNIVNPPCNHSLCIQCYSNNLLHNKHTGHNCSICRSTIYNTD